VAPPGSSHREDSDTVATGAETVNEKLIQRILSKAQVPDLLEVLSQRLSQSDLQSLLLEVYRQRSRALTPQHLLK
jgi:hypothetical protein